MANTVKLKRSATAGDAPSANDLEIGEVAINTADGLLYTKHTDGTINKITIADDELSALLSGYTTATDATGSDLIVFYDVDAGVWERSTIANAALQGEKGQKGQGGSDGDKGQKGEVGSKGQKGEVGATGNDGTSGSDGDKGQKGQSGNDGGAGAKGEKGQKGEVGVQGNDGGNGDKGQKGQKGQGGSNGSSGSDGAKGQKGEKGQKGQDGTAGGDGSDGDKGQKGEAGVKGQKGQEGNFGGATFDYTFSTNTADSDPTSGKLKFNNANLSSVSKMYIDNQDGSATSIVTFLRTIDDSTSTIKGHFRISNRLNADDFALFTISGSITEATGYVKVNCSYVSGSATSFSNNEDIIITFARTGDAGDTGAAGSDGSDGAKGQKGEKGQKGQTGAGGSNGTDGDKGQKGQTGQTGAAGSDGSDGGTGQKGQKGQTGQTGSDGNDGGTGQKGQKGEVGANGSNGSNGSKGEKGQKGEVGAGGSDGSNGSKGEKGQKGQAGSNGSDGSNGTKGEKGQKGQTGGSGSDGTNGTKGEKGQKGQTGGSGSDGSDGTKGEKGQKGQTGGGGSDGSDGTDGDKGQKGQTGGGGSKGQKGEGGLTTTDADTLDGQHGSYYTPTKHHTVDDETIFAITDYDTTETLKAKFFTTNSSFTKVDDSTAPASGVFKVSGYVSTVWGEYIPMDDETEIMFECWVKHVSGSDTSGNLYVGGEFYSGSKSSYGNVNRYWGANGDSQDSNTPSPARWRHIKGVMKGSVIRASSNTPDAQYVRLLALFNYNASGNASHFCGFRFYRSKKTISSLWLRTHNGSLNNDSGLQNLESSSAISIINNTGVINAHSDIYLADQIIHMGDTDTYMQFHAANQWRVVTGGTERLEVSNGTTLISNTLDMNNGNITNVNGLYIADPGPGEGIKWNGGNQWQIYESPDNLSTNGSGNLQFTSGTGVGSMRMRVDTSGNFTASGNVTAYSDERLKDNIETLDGSKAYEMRGVSFTKDGQAGSGVIAQELQKVAPELVQDNGEHLSVAYGNLVGYLIETVKELNDRVKTLEAKLEKD